MQISKHDNRPDSATVVICTHSVDRWQTLEYGVSVAAKQLRFDDELLVVVDHNDALLAKCRESLANCAVLANVHRPGLSGARNTAIEHAKGIIVVFLDDDAVPRDGWLDALRGPYLDERVQGVGGDIDPHWLGGRPGWFSDEFLWVVGCIHKGLRSDSHRVRNLVGANMSVRRSTLRQLGGFVETMGRVAGRPLGCEETELCIRLSQANSNAILLYNPAASVEHHISPERSSFRYFARRCWAEGFSKAEVARRVGRSSALSEERYYISHVLPRAIWRGLRETSSGHVRGVARSFAIIVGLMLTSTGFCVDVVLRSLGRVGAN